MFVREFADVSRNKNINDGVEFTCDLERLGETGSFDSADANNVELLALMNGFPIEFLEQTNIVPILIKTHASREIVAEREADWYCIGRMQVEKNLVSLTQLLAPLDDSSDQPLYQQLQRSLRSAIENRIIGPDDALPPERDLAEMLAVSRITVRKAIDELVEEGLLIRKQGSGTFVSNRVEKNFAKLTSFSEDMRARGREPRSVWINKAAGTVTPEESLTLRSSPGTPVFRFHRIRFADDAPMALEYATVLSDCLPSVDAVETSLYEALERSGNRPVRALQRLRAVLLTAEQAKLLKAQERDAGLLVARVGYLKDGRAVEFSQSYYRGEIYDFVAELSASS